MSHNHVTVVAWVFWLEQLSFAWLMILIRKHFHCNLLIAFGRSNEFIHLVEEEISPGKSQALDKCSPFSVASMAMGEHTQWDKKLTCKAHDQSQGKSSIWANQAQRNPKELKRALSPLAELSSIMVDGKYRLQQLLHPYICDIAIYMAKHFALCRSI